MIAVVYMINIHLMEQCAHAAMCKKERNWNVDGSTHFSVISLKTKSELTFSSTLKICFQISSKRIGDNSFDIVANTTIFSFFLVLKKNQGTSVVARRRHKCLLEVEIWKVLPWQPDSYLHKLLQYCTKTGAEVMADILFVLRRNETFISVQQHLYPLVSI